MADASDKSFAIIRVPPNKRVHLFSLLVENGYSEVAFTSDLAGTAAKWDPPVTTATAASSSSVKEDPARVSSSSAAAATATAAAVSTSGQPPPTTPQHSSRGTANEDIYSTPPSNSNPTDLLQSMIDHSAEEDNKLQYAPPPYCIMPNGAIMQAPCSLGQPIILAGPPIDMTGRLIPGGGAAQFDFSGAGSSQQSNRSLHYSGSDGMGRKMPFVERMKGWQRKMLAETLVNGLPSGAELAELCARCQVTETQAVRFFRKRKLGFGVGEGGYQMEDDGDGMRADSPDLPAYQPKTEGLE
ncbi:hypothetical protein PFISCL1PPCAC_17328 [Pristionchus fissidentatus]|uniref:Homeobox domain-containing protein n=1 Tax=Pristionchus fissidentatus TaxID=1538716 RepID=A0AAV5W5H0_9BILA|nr:hypothetical protein PFISCL1PPCAC_17328 [Pristionchus fissidentatus]